MGVNLTKFGIKFDENLSNFKKKLNLIRILIKSIGLNSIIKVNRV